MEAANQDRDDPALRRRMSVASGPARGELRWRERLQRLGRAPSPPVLLEWLRPYWIFAPLAVVSLFNAIWLLPEILIPIPSVNDDAYHYMLVDRAAQALISGQNPLDHWN